MPAHQRRGHRAGRDHERLGLEPADQQGQDEGDDDRLDRLAMALLGLGVGVFPACSAAAACWRQSVPSSVVSSVRLIVPRVRSVARVGPCASGIASRPSRALIECNGFRRGSGTQYTDRPKTSQRDDLARQVDQERLAQEQSPGTTGLPAQNRESFETGLLSPSTKYSSSPEPIGLGRPRTAGAGCRPGLLV